jgi:hypothetical protein
MNDVAKLMKTVRRMMMPAWLVAIGLTMCGCSTPDLNPPAPRANTGYVDFYTDADLGLSWEIKRRDDSSAKLRTVYSEFDPVQGSVLRLASPPGNYSFQVWFINRATTGPKWVDVRVEDGKVTPVHVSLISEGGVAAARKEYRFGGSAKGPARGTKIITDKDVLYGIEAVAGTPQVYQSKERMAYWSCDTQ